MLQNEFSTLVSKLQGGEKHCVSEELKSDILQLCRAYKAIAFLSLFTSLFQMLRNAFAYKSSKLHV